MFFEQGMSNNELLLYGSVDPSIELESFCWKETEEVIFTDEIMAVISAHAENRTGLLFLTQTCGYPVDFYIDKLGMWEKIKKKFDLLLNDTIEYRKKLSRYELFWGIGEFHQEMMKLVIFVLWQTAFQNFIVLRKDTEGSNEAYLKYLEINDTGYCVNYNALIHKECKAGNIVIVHAIYSEGRMLNIFKARD